MCWSATASVGMTTLGGAAMAVAVLRGEPKAIWLTLGYFTVMEGLQAVGYAVVDECGTAANWNITLLSYLHIAFQPIFVNAFAMTLAPTPVSRQKQRWVYALAALGSAFMVLKLLPIEALGHCPPGASLCGAVTCTISGDWHIAWTLQLNGSLDQFAQIFGINIWFPAYFLAAFALPLWYGAWRFVVFHLSFGPILAMTLTSNNHEMPAIWCLFSIGIIVIALSPFVRYRVMRAYNPADPVPA